MFSRRGILSFLPAFLVPKVWSKKPEQTEHWALLVDKQPHEPAADTGITHKQLRMLAVSLPLHELKILIESLEKLPVPRRYRRENEPLAKYQYEFPSGSETYHNEEERASIIAFHEEISKSAREVLSKK